MNKRIAVITLALLVLPVGQSAYAACGAPPTAAVTDTLVRLKNGGGIWLGTVSSLSDTSSGNAGDVVYDSTNNTLAFCNGSSWVDAASTAAASQWVNGSGGAIYYTSGPIGIGTTGPVSALDISGNYTGGNGPFLTLQQYAGNNAQTFGPGIVMNNHVSGTHPFIVEEDQTTASNFNIAEPVSPYAAYLTITQSGYVGIGTTSPQNTLDVYGPTFGLGTTAAGSRINGRGPDSNAGLWLQYVDGNAYYDSAIGTYLRVNGNSGLLNAMYLSSNGNVGIGTTSPSAGLHYYGSAYPETRIESTAIETDFSIKSDSTNGRDYWLISGGSSGAFSGGSFGVWDNTAGAPRAYIASGANGWVTPSDRRLKSHIATLNVLDRLGPVRGVSYRLKDSGKPQIGVIAQEVKQSFPAAVTGDGQRGFLGVSYEAIAAIALQGVKELKAQLDERDAVIARLKETNDNEAAEIEALSSRVEALEAKQR